MGILSRHETLLLHLSQNDLPFTTLIPLGKRYVSADKNDPTTSPKSVIIKKDTIVDIKLVYKLIGS